MPLLRGSSVKPLPFRPPLKSFVPLVANKRERQYGNGPGAREAARGGVFRAQGVGLGRRVIHGAQPRKAAIFSLGVHQPRHLRGRSLRNVSIRLSSARPMPAKDDFLGWSLRISPFVFSFVPRSHE